MAKDPKCSVCGSFLNRRGICLTCNPVRKKPKNPWHGNTKPEQKRRRPS